MAASQMHSSLVFLRLSWSWRLTLTSGLSQQTNITEAKEIEVGDRYDHLGSPSSTRIFPGDPVQLTCELEKKFSASLLSALLRGKV